MKQCSPASSACGGRSTTMRRSRAFALALVSPCPTVIREPQRISIRPRLRLFASPASRDRRARTCASASRARAWPTVGSGPASQLLIAAVRSLGRPPPARVTKAADVAVESVRSIRSPDSLARDRTRPVEVGTAWKVIVVGAPQRGRVRTSLHAPHPLRPSAHRGIISAPWLIERRGSEPHCAEWPRTWWRRDAAWRIWNARTGN